MTVPGTRRCKEKAFAARRYRVRPMRHYAAPQCGAERTALDPLRGIRSCAPTLRYGRRVGSCLGCGVASLQRCGFAGVRSRRAGVPPSVCWPELISAFYFIDA